MNSVPNHIAVCICTFKRPEFLKQLLHSLTRQQAAGFTFQIVVADNDDQESARGVVAEFSKTSSIQTVYCAEPRQNIALARNKALENARGEFIAFIDDDEFPEENWLLMLKETCEQYQVAGVLGPVKPHFDKTPPAWILKGKFCDRPEQPTGTVMEWEKSRTGNLLFRREILKSTPEPFKPEFGTGGEDKDFFMRMTQKGFVFVWCNEAVVFETVPPARWQRRYMLKRALLRGKNVLKHPTGRARLIATSAVAVPIYTVILLPALIFGQHCFMKYCIKLCDHLGRLLAFVRINPVNER